MLMMIWMLERARFSNSSSTASISLWIERKISWAVACISRWAGAERMFAITVLVRPVVSELHVNAEIVIAQGRDNLLQRVAVAARDAHGVALDRRLHFELRVFYELDDLFGLLLRNALLQSDTLANRPAQGRFDTAVSQSLERHAALDQFRLQDVVEALQLVLVVRSQNDRFLSFKFDVALAPFEIEPRMDFLQSLIDGVDYLGVINLRNDVECVLLRHNSQTHPRLREEIDLSCLFRLNACLPGRARLWPCRFRAQL